jgi:hypothetical protein
VILKNSFYIGRSFGGIGNAIQYIINEGWVTKESIVYDDTTRSQETDNKSTSINNDNYKLIVLNNDMLTKNTGNAVPIINIEGSNLG